MERPMVAKGLFVRGVLLVLLIGANGWLAAPPAASVLDVPTAAAASINDTPTPLIASGVEDYTLAAPKLFWHARNCETYIGSTKDAPAETNAPVEQNAPAETNAPVDSEYVARIATYGSSTRTLYAASVNGYCGALAHTFQSNMVADADYVYAITNQGLVRISTSANAGDTPKVFVAGIATSGELAMGSDVVYVLTGGSAKSIIAVNKTSGAPTTVVGTPGSGANSLSFDGTYLYVVDSGTLKRFTSDGNAILTTIKNGGVSSYHADGPRLTICGINPLRFCTANNVYFAVNNQLFLYNSISNSAGSAIYTAASTSQFSDITTTGGGLVGNLLFFEDEPTCTSSCFPSYRPILKRATLSGSNVVPLYPGAIQSSTLPLQLTTDGTYVFWHENGALQRLPVDASALPQINMRVTGLEVTQGIQNLSNGVLLVKGRRTFVRMYVKSDGAAVAGVGAQLSSSLGTLQPVNSTGTKLTVRPTPDRNDINQSFLFELPWNWTQGNSLSLTGVLNPYRVPLQTNYSNNTRSATVSFKPSPKLTVEFFNLNYTIGTTTYRPRNSADVAKTYSWIMRAYPIGGAVGQNFKPEQWYVEGGTQLGNWVNRSSGDCTAKKIGDPDLSLCASFYTNGWLDYYRTHAWVPNTNAFYYGMISDTSNNFPRGQAIYNKTSVGPAGTPCSPFNLGCGWDTDGSYADWYAGHEIGHSLGRAHPNAGSDNPATTVDKSGNAIVENCGHSRSDPSFPYGNTTSAAAPIGPSDGSMEGFDVGDASFGIARAVYPSATWNDVMSYCSNQWISDYTYTGMYNNMIANPSAAPLDLRSKRTMQATGDFLQVVGVIDPTANSAAFARVQRLNSIADQPPITAGDYSIRLVDGSNATLATYSFTPEQQNDDVKLGFNQVVNFAAGTRAVQIIRNAGGAVLETYAISANPPTISNVALQNAPDPVNGVVTLGWTASDPDGDALTFDIFYSRDNGATFQPVQMGATGSSAQIDTAQLGGSGTAILRVVANDGVNAAEATSASFTMANKAPQPFIMTPGDNTHTHFGQLVNFSGMAMDAQDNLVGDGGLVWKDAGGNTLGTGALISLDNLPVGNNVISLVATNSVGVSASASVTVIVDDDLNLPGPTLSAGPGQVGWQISAGTSTPQTAAVTVNNIGSGAADWSASSDQPWLTLSAASGTVAADGDPATLTLSANPAGLAAGTSHRANLTLTRKEGDVVKETIVVPVTLSIGDTRATPVETRSAVPRGIFLPMIQR